MAAILVEEEVERKPEGVCAGGRAKAAFFDKVEDGRIAAERFVKRGRYVFEDGLEEAAHKVKREPFKFVAMAFAAGAFFGFVMPRFGKRST